MVDNYENYGPYVELVKTGRQTIKASEISLASLEFHFNSILNILRDGIETELIATAFITVDFDEGLDVDLTIPDYYFNLIMWHLILHSDRNLKPNNIFFDENITRKSIKEYIDEQFIDVNRGIIDNKLLNNIIDDCLFKMNTIDEFSFFFANTINLEDTIHLMNAMQEVNDLIHTDISKTPLDEIKNYGMDNMKQLIKHIKADPNHSLGDFFRANEGINIKQAKEVFTNIGTKPDGNGSVYTIPINSNFVNGGVNDPISFLLESSSGRTAQMIVEGNVGTSGAFARLLGLNSTDSFLHPDRDYVCDSENFQEIQMPDTEEATRLLLNRFGTRYYRFAPKGMEYNLSYEDIKYDSKRFVGKKMYFRSPMTCASAAAGHGICYRCYGKLAYTNKIVNIGKMAAEIMSAILTQMMLSAKHLLESAIKKQIWTERFEEFLEVNANVIQLRDDIDLKDYKLVIDPYGITPENEQDQLADYNEYITEFFIQTPKGEMIPVHAYDSDNDSADNLYITVSLNQMIREIGTNENDMIVLKLEELVDTPLFLMQIHNNELSKILKKIINIINKGSETSKLNRHEILQTLNETLIEGGMNVSSVHAEVILSNQIRNIDNILEMPQWQYPDEPYRILTLNQALTDNPSLIIRLSYQKVSKTLFNPLTFRCNKPSFMDLFFMEKPQEYLNKEDIVKTDKKFIENELKQAVIFDVPKVTDEDDEIGCDEE